MATDFGMLGPVIYYGLVVLFLFGFFATLGLMGLFVVGVCLDLRDRWRSRAGLRRFL